MTATPLRSILVVAVGLTFAIASSAHAGIWTRIFDPYSVRAIAVDSADASVIYAGTDGNGIFKTTNGGVDWDPASTGLTDTYAGYLLSIAIDPTDSDVLYAGTNGSGL